MTGFRVAIVLATIVILLTACTRGGDSYEREQALIQRSSPAVANLVSSTPAQRTGHSIMSSWEYQIPSSLDAAKKAFQERVPSNYSLVQASETELSFSKFDGHDEFDLILKFGKDSENSSKVSVSLRSYPD